MILHICSFLIDSKRALKSWNLLLVRTRMILQRTNAISKIWSFSFHSNRSCNPWVRSRLVEYMFATALWNESNRVKINLDTLQSHLVNALRIERTRGLYQAGKTASDVLLVPVLRISSEPRNVHSIRPFIKPTDLSSFDFLVQYPSKRASFDSQVLARRSIRGRFSVRLTRSKN